MGLFKKKPTIDPVDLLVLRNEMVELKERLDASEQGKAALEDRISSIAATTMIMTNTAQSNTAEIVEQIESIQLRIDTSVDVSSKVDELHQRVIEVEHRSPAAGELGEPVDLSPKLAALSSRIEQVAQLAAAPAQPDDELAAKLDELAKSAAGVEILQRQFGQLSSRVSVQAELADQLRALSDRISLLQERSVDTSALNNRIDQLATAIPLTDDLGERLVDLTARVTAGEAELSAAKQKTEAIEQQLSQSQVDELIASLNERIARGESDAKTALERSVQLQQQLANDTSADDLRAELAQVSARLAEQSISPDQLTELSAKLEAQVDATARLAASAPDTEALNKRLAELQAGIDAQTTLTAQLEAVQQRVEASERAAQEASERATALATQFAGTSGAGSEDLGRRIDEISEKLASQGEFDERLVALDTRIGALDAQGFDVHRIHELLDQLRQSTPSTEHIDAQLADLSTRITAGEQATKDVGLRADFIDGRIGDIDGRLGDVVERTGDLDHLRSRIDEQTRLAEQLEELTARLNAQSEWPDQLAALNARISELASGDVDVDAIHRRIDELANNLPSSEGLHQQIAELSERMSTGETDVRAARDQAAAIEDRLGNISTELANQLTELSTEIDSLASRADEGSPVTVTMDDVAVEGLRTGQVKLAAEQARYEINFREDLANLAEQVRQLRGRS